MVARGWRRCFQADHTPTRRARRRAQGQPRPGCAASTTARGTTCTVRPVSTTRPTARPAPFGWAPRGRVARSSTGLRGTVAPAASRQLSRHPRSRSCCLRRTPRASAAAPTTRSSSRTARRAWITATHPSGRAPASTLRMASATSHSTTQGWRPPPRARRRGSAAPRSSPRRRRRRHQARAVPRARPCRCYAPLRPFLCTTTRRLRGGRGWRRASPRDRACRRGRWRSTTPRTSSTAPHSRASRTHCGSRQPLPATGGAWRRRSRRARAACARPAQGLDPAPCALRPAPCALRPAPCALQPRALCGQRPHPCCPSPLPPPLTTRQAHLFIVPAFGSLSEAVAGCEGTTHMQRQAEAAAALRASPWFVKWPQRCAPRLPPALLSLASRPPSSASPFSASPRRWLSPRRLLPLPPHPAISLPARHVILASSHSADDHDPLGALGSLAAKAGAVSQPHRPLHHRYTRCTRCARCACCACCACCTAAATAAPLPSLPQVALCVDREKCQAGFRKKAIVPPLPLPPLLLPSVRQRQADQACARGGGERRRVSVYWRGRHTKDADAGPLRARLW